MFNKDQEQDLEDGYGAASMMATKESEIPLRLQDQSTLVPLDLKQSSIQAKDND